MSTPSAILDELKKQAFTLGRSGSHDDVNEALHEETVHGLDHLLSFHTETLTEDEIEAIQLEYKDGFWEDTETRAHQQTRAQLQGLAEASRQFQEHVLTLIQYIECHHNTPGIQSHLDAVATASEHLTTQRPDLP